MLFSICSVIHGTGGGGSFRFSWKRNTFITSYEQWVSHAQADIGEGSVEKSELPSFVWASSIFSGHFFLKHFHWLIAKLGKDQEHFTTALSTSFFWLRSKVNSTFYITPWHVLFKCQKHWKCYFREHNQKESSLGRDDPGSRSKLRPVVLAIHTNDAQNY